MLSSGYIAGGTLIGLVIAFFAFLPGWFSEALNLGRFLGSAWTAADSPYPKLLAVAAFAAIALFMLWIAARKEPQAGSEPEKTVR